jgi:hypothetical protein
VYVIKYTPSIRVPRFLIAHYILDGRHLSIRRHVPSGDERHYPGAAETKYVKCVRVTCSSAAACSVRNLPMGEARAKLTNTGARPMQTESSALLSPSRM